MDTYILQKDLPNAKVGAKYRKTYDGKDYINDDLVSQGSWDVTYPKEYIENNPEWFKKEEPKEPLPIKVVGIGYSHDNPHGRWYQFGTSIPINTKKYEPIKKAIEFVLNHNEHPITRWDGVKLYTEDELLEAQREAFAHAYLQGILNDICSNEIINSEFEDYLKSLNKQ